ncbi:MAG: zinc ribbon domain-containing protein [Isosphaeraceae bacterium]
MPIYEYRCEPCRHEFEALIRSSSDVAECPKCRGTDVAKLFSVPAAAQAGGKGSSLPICGDTGAPMMMGGCGGGGCRSGMCGLD